MKGAWTDNMVPVWISSPALCLSICLSAVNNKQAGPAPALSAQQRQAGAAYASAKAGLQRSAPAEPLALSKVSVGPLSKVSVGPAPLKPVVAKVAAAAGLSKPLSGAAVQPAAAGTQQQQRQQQQKVLGRGFALPLSVDVAKGGLFDFHLRVNGRRK